MPNVQINSENMFCFLTNCRKQKLKHENVCTFFREVRGHSTQDSAENLAYLDVSQI